MALYDEVAEITQRIEKKLSGQSKTAFDKVASQLTAIQEKAKEHDLFVEGQASTFQQQIAEREREIQELKEANHAQSITINEYYQQRGRDVAMRGIDAVNDNLGGGIKNPSKKDLGAAWLGKS